jgi:hypothetical protein
VLLLFSGVTLTQLFGSSVARTSFLIFGVANFAFTFVGAHTLMRFLTMRQNVRIGYGLLVLANVMAAAGFGLHIPQLNVSGMGIFAAAFASFIGLATWKIYGIFPSDIKTQGIARANSAMMLAGLVVGIAYPFIGQNAIPGNVALSQAIVSVIAAVFCAYGVWVARDLL